MYDYTTTLFLSVSTYIYTERMTEIAALMQGPPGPPGRGRPGRPGSPGPQGHPGIPPNQGYYSPRASYLHSARY